MGSSPIGSSLSETGGNGLFQGITADEEADDIFCERMYQNYLDDPDPEKDRTYTLEECKKEWGID